MPVNPHEHRYAATASHSSLYEGEVSGEILLDSQSFRFRSEAGEVEIPLDRLQIERTGTDQFLFYDPEQTDWSVYTSEPGILSDYYFKRRNSIRLQVREILAQREGLRTLRLAAVFLACFAALAGLAWMSSGWVLQFLVNRVPVAWEKNLGQSLLDEAREDLHFDHDPKLSATFGAVTNHLLRGVGKTDYQFRFHLVADPTPNAHALPGGHVIVNTGLFEMASSPRELAGVLAHEIAHVTQRHGMRKMISTAGPYYVLRLFISDQAGFLAAVSEGSQLLLQQNFSRELEREADQIAWQYLVAASIDPRGLAEFLRKCRDAMPAAQVTGRLNRLLSSHPPTEERIRHLASLWQAAPRKSGFVELLNDTGP